MGMHQLHPNTTPLVNTGNQQQVTDREESECATHIAATPHHGHNGTLSHWPNKPKNVSSKSHCTLTRLGRKEDENTKRWQSPSSPGMSPATGLSLLCFVLSKKSFSYLCVCMHARARVCACCVLSPCISGVWLMKLQHTGN